MFSLVRRLSISALVVALHAGCALAEQSAFMAQCTKLLPRADEFSAVCLTHARTFSRTFYPGAGSRGETEAYSTYFQQLDAPSHFLLGCVLDFKRKLSFVGIYYSAEPMDMAHFDDYPIVFVDPNGNVAVSVAGIQHTLVAVRQFVTQVIPPRLQGRPKNCEEVQIETFNGVVANTRNRFRQTDKNEFEFCGGTACRGASYSTFVREHGAPIVYADHDVFLIDANGALMIKNEYLDRACSASRGNAAGLYNIIFEMCHRQRM